MNKIFSDSSDWQELLDMINEKQLTAIVGKEMYKYKENAALADFEDYLSRKVLEAYGVAGHPFTEITDVVKYLKNVKQVKSIDLNRKLKSLVKEIEFEFPLLTSLISITNLNYFVNTVVYNNLLETMISRQRKADATPVNFSINEPFTDTGNLENLKSPFVFNIFGSLLNTIDPALSEDDMLEYTGYFKEKLENTTNIINALKNKNLLFIGCSFPDWMVRFVLRFLTNEPLSEWGNKRTIIMVHDQAPIRDSQSEFLRNHNVVTYEGNTADFVNELSARWNNKKPQSSKPKTIFLSYTIKDKTAVETLKRSIESIGNINCWYDKREIAAGDDFKTEIAKNIRSADLFIPLISENSLLHKDGYVQLEWITADNVNTFRKLDNNTGKYLMPVVIDNTNAYDTSVPRFFSELSIGKVPQGNPDAEFLEQLKKTLDIT
jgi:hypothetical protein